MIARDIMTTSVVTIAESASIYDAAKLMLDEDVSCLPVVSERAELIGILTHADFGLSPKFRPLMENVYNLLGATTTTEHLEETAKVIGSRSVRDAMTRNVLTVSQDTEIKDIARLMLRYQVHRLPIVNGKEVVGIITRHDFLKLIAVPH